jgi:hypothetical protein
MKQSTNPLSRLRAPSPGISPRDQPNASITLIQTTSKTLVTSLSINLTFDCLAFSAHIQQSTNLLPRFRCPILVSIIETSPIQQIRCTIRPLGVNTEICHTTIQQSIVLPQSSNPLGIGYMIWHTTIKLPSSSNR